MHFPPPPPYLIDGPFRPFIVAEVEFPEGIQVIGPATGYDGLQPAIGTKMQTVVAPYYTNADGTEVIGWKFRPSLEGDIREQ